DARFERMEAKLPWVPLWKGQCRTKVRECDAAIVLLSKKTNQGVGIGWELECASEAQMPLLGGHVDKYEKGSAPAELKGCPIIDWNWPEIAGFIQGLSKDKWTARA